MTEYELLINFLKNANINFVEKEVLPSNDINDEELIRIYYADHVKQDGMFVESKQYDRLKNKVNFVSAEDGYIVNEGCIKLEIENISPYNWSEGGLKFTFTKSGYLVSYYGWCY